MGSVRILCVDDDATTTRAMKQQLDRIENADVKRATTRDDAKKLLTEHGVLLAPFDVVVSDAKMHGEWDGFEVLKFAKIMNPECVVILHTGLAVEEHRAKVNALARLGNFSVLQKPTMDGDLARLVGKKLKERDACKEAPDRETVLKEIAGLERSRGELSKFVHLEAGSRGGLGKYREALDRKIEEKRKLLG